MHDYDYIYRSFVKGDVTPFYEDLYPGLLLYASRQLGPDLSYLAEDCVQDAVMSSYTERKRLRTSMAWYAYILKCIYHSAIGLVRKHNSRNNYLESPENEHVTPGLEVAMLEQETLDRLHAAIESLPVKYRTLLRMSYQEGLKNAEIARRLGVAEITVKKQKAQMLMMLRDGMGDVPPYVIILVLSGCAELSA